MCTLDEGGHLCEAPSDLPPLPDIGGVSFYDVSCFSEKYVVQQLELLENLSIEQILTQHLLPWMAMAQDIASISAKAALVDWVRIFGVHISSFEPNVESRDMSREHLHLLVRPVLKLATPPQTSKANSEMIIRYSTTRSLLQIPGKRTL